MPLIFRMVGTLMGKNHVKSVTLLILDNSDGQGMCALNKDTSLNCFEIPNVSVLFMADLGDLDGNFTGLTWQISKYVHSCTLLKSLHSVKANGCLKSFQQLCRIESLKSEECRIWLHFLPFSFEPVCKDLNGILFKQ